MRVSIVLPTYNECDNIVPLICSITDVLSGHYEFEILVIDDNSPDGTYQFVYDRFKEDKRVIPILRTKDRGFAKSIREGIERASFEQIVVMDTDFTHDPKLLANLLHVSVVYDVVSASRFAPGGDMHDGLHYIASLLYNFVLRLIIRTQVQDNLGGYFTSKRSHILELPLDIIFQGYGEYYFRLIYFMQKYKRSFVEIPAIYAMRTEGKSKSNFIKMMFVYFYYALKLKAYKS